MERPENSKHGGLRRWAEWKLADVTAMAEHLARVRRTQVWGRVRSVIGLSVRATVPGARVGDVVVIERKGRNALPAQVVGFDLGEVTLMPLGSLEGIGPNNLVRSTGKEQEIRVENGLLGRVLDGLGRPIDGGPPLSGRPYPVMRDPPNPMRRARIERPLLLGIRVLDGLLTAGEGQRIGLFAGSGVGKSTLLGQIARQAQADVFVVCLIGERGREVREFLEDALGEEGRKRGVVVCATSDAPAMVRKMSAYVATAIAEFFRDQGKRVLLLVDSVTRFARAGREVGLAAGEVPARRGYPPSVFAELPRLLERSGMGERGSITAFYTVLVEGGDMEEPIADEIRGILDGHVVLDRGLAARGRFPAVDPLASLSRVMDRLVDPEHLKAAHRLRSALALYESKRDLITLGAYKKGSDPQLDRVLSRIDLIESFLCQRPNERSSWEETCERLRGLV
ncbi:MAG: FliI/YscN family ATPase [Sandaracinaceae bacterium]|nr:FliI/YscN family ATPase [Sandaracinaceae bacterium]